MGADHFLQFIVSYVQSYKPYVWFLNIGVVSLYLLQKLRQERLQNMKEEEVSFIHAAGLLLVYDAACYVCKVFQLF